MPTKWIMIMQTASAIRRHHAQRETLRGLGLLHIRHAKLVRNTPETRGMIRKVRHLVHVFEGPLMGKLTPAMVNDLNVLRRFNRRVTRTEQSGFWKRYKNQIPNVVSRFDKPTLQTLGPARFAIEGQVQSFLEDFDQDEINAFVLDYRQYTQNNDAISIGSISRIYSQPWMHPGARQNFEEIRRRTNRMFDAGSHLLFGDYHMPVRELVEIVVYGGLAHSNPEKANIFEDWENSGMMGYVWAPFFAAMRDLMRYLKQIRTLNEQVLDVADPAQSETLAMIQIESSLPNRAS